MLHVACKPTNNFCDISIYPLSLYRPTLKSKKELKGGAIAYKVANPFFKIINSKKYCDLYVYYLRATEDNKRAAQCRAMM